MSIITLLLMAVGLSMDAFAVSISSGILLCKARWGQTFKIAGAFGLFQGIMPFIGYTIARLFARQIQAFDHWIAFGLLVFIGGKMLWEVLRGMLAGNFGYLLCCAVIAAVTFAICAVGVKIGCKTGDMFGRKAEIAGGVVLIGIGVKILLEHLLGG